MLHAAPAVPSTLAASFRVFTLAAVAWLAVTSLVPNKLQVLMAHKPVVHVTRAVFVLLCLEPLYKGFRADLTLSCFASVCQFVCETQTMAACGHPICGPLGRRQCLGWQTSRGAFFSVGFRSRLSGP